MKLFKKTLLVVISILLMSSTSYAYTYFLTQQWGGTWHDVNKSGVDDSLMCWAASASNILDWGRWDTVSDPTERHIFGEFKQHWTNNRGWQSWAWNWWLTGAPPPYKTYAYVNVSGGGNNFPGVNFNSYYATAFGLSEMDTMANLMGKGYGISLIIGPNRTNQHAITAWGYDYTIVSGKKNFTGLYITDSDDGVIALKRMGLAYSDTKGWYLTSGYTNWSVTGVYAFGRRAGTPKEYSASSSGSGGLPAGIVPITPTWVMFITGIGALGFLRLRKNK